MPYQSYAKTQKKLELRIRALAANIEETPHLKPLLAQLEAFLAQLKELSAQQASLTASRQEVSKQLAGVNDKAQKLMTCVDLGVKGHYGNRSEKLVEYGLQPFRSKPRVRRVGPDGKPLKRTRKAAGAKATASTENE